MTLKVCLQDIVNELAGVTEDITAYLNSRTGEFCTLTADEIAYIEEGGDEETEVTDISPDSIKANEILNSGEWLPLPTQWDIHEYQIMEEFCSTVSEPIIQEQLLRAIQGHGAFRRFKEIIYQQQLEEKWYGYRDEAYKNIAIRWLDAQHISYE